MDNSAIAQRVNFIRQKLKLNAATFVLDDSADLIHEWEELQKECSHTSEEGIYYFDLENSNSCPVCRLEKRRVRKND